MKRVFSNTLGVIAVLLLTQGAWAHPGHGAAGFGNGILHPLTGVDHICAMVAVGLWATQLVNPQLKNPAGRRALWLVPASFVTMMVVGACLAFAGFRIPFIEQGIAASVLVLGLLIVFAIRMPTSAGMFLVGLFAMFHGYAHGSEMHPESSALTFAIGFVIATVILHVAGIAFGLAIGRMKHPLYTRAAGAALVACAVLLFAGIL